MTSKMTFLATASLAMLAVAAVLPRPAYGTFVIGGAGDLYDASFDVDGLDNNFRVHLVYGDAGTLFQDTTFYVVNDDTGNSQSSVNNLPGGTFSNSNFGTNNDGGGILTRVSTNIDNFTATWHIDASSSGYVITSAGVNGGLIGIFGSGTSRDVMWEVSTDNANWTTWLRDGDLATVGTQAAINDVSSIVNGASHLYIRLTGSQTGGDWWNTQAGRTNTIPGGTALDIQLTLTEAQIPEPSSIILAVFGWIGLAAMARRRT